LLRISRISCEGCRYADRKFRIVCCGCCSRQARDDVMVGLFSVRYRLAPEPQPPSASLAFFHKLVPGAMC
jgi:hypothetical protein